MSLPNIISLGRLLSVPFNVWLILVDQWRLALLIFCIAGLSDALDGLIAKRFRMQTLLGKYLDAIADKVLLVSIFISLGVDNHVPLWLIILVVSRDMLIWGGLLLLYLFEQSYVPKPFLLSKINTTSQILLAASVIAELAFNIDELLLCTQVLTLVVTFTTVTSGTQYLIDWWQRMNNAEFKE